uniref:Uncharacterized protein n=1 Tax=Rhizophora mucronata TaxID=61149 RepID=A0A2P2IMJ2_RHIMU
MKDELQSMEKKKKVWDLVELIKRMQKEKG